jgi:antirestriction protein ArdC
MQKTHSEVVQQIIDQLEKGVIPWKKTWTAVGGALNMVSKKPYRGINVFLLACAPYGSPYWLSFKQAQQLGGNIKKGSKSTGVVFFKMIEGEDKNGNAKSIPLLRTYPIFNLEQTEGIEAPVEVKRDFSPIQEAEYIIENMPQRPPISYGGDRAFYSPQRDSVQMPHKESFHREDFYYSTLFHELVHSTGSKTRLDRAGVRGFDYFGSNQYSQEELIAELGATMLSNRAGIEQELIGNSAAYIQSWLTVLKADKKILFTSSSAAQKAVDFILDEKYVHEEKENAE